MKDTGLLTRRSGAPHPFGVPGSPPARLARCLRALPLGVAALAACGLGVRAGLAATPGALTLPPGASASGATFLEEDDGAVAWSGAWFGNALAANSGGSARLAMSAGAQASLTFSGTGVSWIGYRDEWCGVARVSLDGVPQASVDTYAAPAQARATLFAVSGLAPGTHTLVIEATGTRAEASAGAWVWVDAFAVTPAPSSALAPAPAPAPAFGVLPWYAWPTSAQASPASRGAPGSRPRRPASVRRLEQDDPAVTWSGAWSTSRLAALSGGSARLAMEASSRVSVVFEGRGVSWIGYRDEWSGIAEVLLNGRLRTSVDTYASPAQAGAALYTIDGLPEGTHTLVVQPTGRRRPASGGAWIWVDAFAITR